MPVSSVTEHWIKPDAVTINLNHFGDPDYLQVSVLAGAVVMAFKQDVIAYNAAHNYRTWPLQASNTHLETISAYNVYARLTRSEVNAIALIIYDPVLRDIEGREITYAGDGSELLGDADPDFFYIHLGQVSESINNNGEQQERFWSSELKFGTLDTTEQNNYTGVLLDKMFRPHYDDELNPDKITSIEALSGLWTHSFISAKGISPNTGGGNSGGLVKRVFGYNDLSGNFLNSDLNNTFNAYTIARLASRISVLEQSGGSGGGGVADSIEWEKVLYRPSWLVDEKPSVSYFSNDAKYITSTALNGYATEQWVLDKAYITSSALNGYATQKWVEGKGYAVATDISNNYATKAALNTLSSSVNSLRTDFDNLNALLNDDVTGKINTWYEVVDFLDEYSGSQDLAAILSGMNTDIASRVEKSKFSDYFATEMAKWFVKDDANKGIKPVNSYGLYSDTYVSAKGVSTGTGGTGGGSSYDRLDKWSDYTTDKAGWVLSALLGQDLNSRVASLESGSALSVTTSGSGNAVTSVSKSGNQLVVTKGATFLTEHQSLAGYATTTALNNGLAGKQDKITNSNKLAYSLISGTPTSLPASDVAAWAKAASKPSYAFSEITNKPTTLGGYGITDAYTATTIDSKLGGYLPLSGGTIDGSIGIGKSDNTAYRYLRITRNGSTVELANVGGIGVLNLDGVGFAFNSTTAYWNGNTLIHSGNYSSYALPLTGGIITGGFGINRNNTTENPNIALSNNNGTAWLGYNVDADSWFVTNKNWYNTYTLIHSGNIGSQSVAGLINEVLTDLNNGSYGRIFTMTSGYGSTYGNKPDADWVTGITLMHANNPKYRTQLAITTKDKIYLRRENEGTWQSWKTIAFTDSNVASATKLQTPRSIWGQSFDGTKDIAGSLYVGGDYGVFLNKDQEGIYLTGAGINWHNSRNAWTNSIIRFDKDGNVGIGTGSPTEKLHVDGNILGKAYLTNGNYGIWRGVNYTSALSINDLAIVGDTCRFFGNIDIFTNKLYWHGASGNYYIACPTTSTGAYLEYAGYEGHRFRAANGEAMRIAPDGNVLIGTSTEEGGVKLLVDGVIKTYHPIFSYAYKNNTNGAAYMFDKPGSYFTGIGSSGVADTIRIGACTINGVWVDYTQNWQFYGNVIATGSVTAKSSSSDIRLKKELTEYSALEIIKNQRSVMYKWNDVAKSNSDVFKTDAWQFGLIAQELQATHPQLVSDVFGDYLTINYERLIPIVWRGVQEVDDGVTRLKAEVQELKNRISMMEGGRYGC